jgi:GH15 family glucan-1,4-alpha-glucosidase
MVEAARRIHGEITERSWIPSLGAYGATFGGDALDAALLQMAPLRFLPGDHPRLVATVEAIATGLSRQGWIDRYRIDDGFGHPQVAFVLCTFWLVQALSRLGLRDRAAALLDQAVKACSPLGLLSEDYDPAGALRGNFPQAYSHVGLIHAAFDASPGWEEIL